MSFVLWWRRIFRQICHNCDVLWVDLMQQSSWLGECRPTTTQIQTLLFRDLCYNRNGWILLKKTAKSQFHSVVVLLRIEWEDHLPYPRIGSLLYCFIQLSFMFTCVTMVHNYHLMQITWQLYGIWHVCSHLKSTFTYRLLSWLNWQIVRFLMLPWSLVHFHKHQLAVYCLQNIN